MRIQGWDETALLDETSSSERARGTFTPARTSLNEHKKTGEKKLPESDLRSELLLKIKKKIASGFYNSDAVIDDIGYGFAQALDHSL